MCKENHLDMSRNVKIAVCYLKCKTKRIKRRDGSAGLAAVFACQIGINIARLMF